MEPNELIKLCSVNHKETQYGNQNPTVTRVLWVSSPAFILELKPPVAHKQKSHSETDSSLSE